MQFIEKNSFSVRSAIYYLEREGSGPRFILFPMVHVGEKRFFAEIASRLAECDLIIAEGVSSKRAVLLTRSYRIIKYIRRLNLITQHQMDTSSLSGKLVNADMEQKEFDYLYSNLPFLDRLQIILLVPVFALYLMLFGTRRLIASQLATEDLPSPDEELTDDMSKNLHDLIVDRRDAVLIQRLRNLADDDETVHKQIGILFGAKHMRNIVAFLFDKLEYRVRRAEWVTVFDL